MALADTNNLIELDTAGKVLWEINIYVPLYASRLRNGNTLVACWPSNQAVEFDLSGKEVWRLKTQMEPNVHRRQLKGST